MQTFFPAAFANVVNTPSFKTDGLMNAAIHPVAFTYAKKATHSISGGYINSVDLVSLPGGGRLENTYFNIEQGNALLNLDKDIRINTHAASICIKAGATVFLMESAMGTVVYDLAQTNSKQVSVIVDNDVMTMTPGQMLVLTKQNTHKFEDLEADCHSINYRRALEINLPNSEIKGFAAQFSILSAIRKIEPLQKLTISTDKHDQLFLDRLLRLAVVMGEVN